MAYNPWYSATYETILSMANWGSLTADIEKKIVAIFSWMPQTIMSVKHRGGRFKFELYKPQTLRDALTPLEESFRGIKEQKLEDFDIPKNTETLKELCDALFPALGSVGGSKYLHFSAPTLLPMWDSNIRVTAGHKDSAAGYVAFMTEFQQKLTLKENRQEAMQRYPLNIVRGWDIVCMERRRRRPTTTPPTMALRRLKGETWWITPAGTKTEMAPITAELREDAFRFEFVYETDRFDGVLTRHGPGPNSYAGSWHAGGRNGAVNDCVFTTTDDEVQLVGRWDESGRLYQWHADLWNE